MKEHLQRALKTQRNVFHASISICAIMNHPCWHSNNRWRRYRCNTLIPTIGGSVNFTKQPSHLNRQTGKDIVIKEHLFFKGGARIFIRCSYLPSHRDTEMSNLPCNVINLIPSIESSWWRKNGALQRKAAVRALGIKHEKHENE